MLDKLVGKYFNDLKWRDMFPYPSFRPNQEELCDDMSNSFLEKPVTIIISPNGSGKTSTALSVVTSTPSDGIWFLTRTHRQIEHIIDEINLIEKKKKMEIPYVELASRKFLCINPDIPKEDDESQKMINILCKDRIKGTLSNSYCDYTPCDDLSIFKIPKELSGSEPSKCGISSLIKYGELNKVCPYHLAKELSKEYPVVFSSYNYIFDPFMRDFLGISLENKIVVVDECHNVQNVMEEAMKRELSLYKTELIMHEKSIPPNIRKYFSKIHDFILEIKNEYARESEEGIDYDSFGAIIEGNDIDDEFIDKMKSAIYIIKDDPKFIRYASIFEDTISFFEIYFEIDSKSFVGYSSVKNTNGKKEIIVGIQSLDITPIIRDLIDEGCRLVFMTGTLNARMFMFLLGLTDDDVNVFRYKSPKRNLDVFITPIGDKNNKLSTYFEARKNENMMADFGHSIKLILPYVNGGSLMFFPSYEFKDQCIDTWDNNQIIKYDYLDKCYYFIYPNGLKIKLFDDQREKSVDIINGFRSYASTHKAVLAACFKSRASEGEDFKDQLSRAIFIIGIPLMNISDKSVIHKMNYYDKRSTGMGNIWYISEAMNAVNQGIGRGIRDAQTDYCAVYLMDSRYKEEKYYGLLTDWIRNSEKSSDRLSTLRASIPKLMKFYEECRKNFGK